MVKIEFGKRDFVWIGMIVVLACVGFGYAYGGSEPAVMGHSAGELEVTDTNAKTVCGNNLFLDGDGQCRTTAQIVADGGGSGTISCNWVGWREGGDTNCNGVSCDTNPGFRAYQFLILLRSATAYRKD